MCGPVVLTHQDLGEENTLGMKKGPVCCGYQSATPRHPVCPEAQMVLRGFDLG